jgi:hypothetical protein
MINESIITQDSPIIASGIFKSVLMVLFALIAIFFISRLKKLEYHEEYFNESILEHIKGKNYYGMIDEDEILADAYSLFRNQCKVSFNFGLAFASLSFFFLLLTTGFLLYRDSTDLAGVSVVAGGLTSFASAIGFYLYHRSSSNQLALAYKIYNQQKEEKKKTNQVTSQDSDIRTHTTNEKMDQRIEETDNEPVASYQ